MLTNLYNYYHTDEYELALEQLEFFEKKLLSIDNDNCNDTNKAYRKRRIELVIKCIKYTYNI